MRHVVVSLLAMSSTFAVAFDAAAADIHVDAAAPPGGDGSAAAPVVEIQAGLELAQPGDVVHVAPGVYGPLETVRDGSEGARIEVVADRRRTAIVQADGTGLRNAHAFHTYRGLVIDGAYGTADLVIGDGGDQAEFIDVEVRRSGRDCFDLRTVVGVRIEGSFIHHCIAVDGRGEVVDAHGVTGDSVFDLAIVDTEIAMASGDSLQLSPPREPWGNVRVEGCTLWTAPLDDPDAGAAVGTPLGENAVDTKVGPDLDGAGQNPRLEIRDTIAHGFQGFIGNQGAFNLKEDVDVRLDGVTVYDTEIAFRLRFPAVVRVQNAVVHSVDNVVRYEDGLVGAVFVNSTMGAGITGDAFEDGGGGGAQGFVLQNLLRLGDALPEPLPAQSNLAVGPDVFVDPAAHDYHLVEGASPIDAGDALPEVAIDRDGTARPYGGGHDIGAYEWEPNTGAGDSTGGGDAGDGTSGGTAADGGGDDEGASTAPSTGGETRGEGTGGGGAGTEDGTGSGCACRTAPTSSRGWLVLVGLAALRRRRPRAGRRPPCVASARRRFALGLFVGWDEVRVPGAACTSDVVVPQCIGMSAALTRPKPRARA